MAQAIEAARAADASTKGRGWDWRVNAERDWAVATGTGAGARVELALLRRVVEGMRGVEGGVLLWGGV